MPLKKTTPRKGAKPMLYFKGSIKGLKRFKHRTIQNKLTNAMPREKIQPDEGKRFLQHLIKTTEKLACGHRTITSILLEKESIPIRITKTKSGRILITQMPQTHAITSGTNQENPSYKNLVSVLRKSFVGNLFPNTTIQTKRHGFNMYGTPNESIGITNGDIYLLEINSKTQSRYEWDKIRKRNRQRPGVEEDQGFIKRAHPSQIVSINIELDQTQGKKVTDLKKDFYKRQIQERFGVPVKFI